MTTSSNKRLIAIVGLIAFIYFLDRYKYIELIKWETILSTVVLIYTIYWWFSPKDSDQKNEVSIQSHELIEGGRSVSTSSADEIGERLRNKIEKYLVEIFQKIYSQFVRFSDFLIYLWSCRKGLFSNFFSAKHLNLIKQLWKSSSYVKFIVILTTATLLCYALYRVWSNREWVNEIDGSVYQYIPSGPVQIENGDNVKIFDIDAFWMMETEVTNAQYMQCVEDNDTCTHPLHQHQWIEDNHPVANVTWEQADTYAKWAKGRLPTEEEWVRACRGNTSNKYPWGEGMPTEKLANVEEYVGHITPVGSYPAGISPYKIMDMVGNVREWTSSKKTENTDEFHIYLGGGFGDATSRTNCVSSNAYYHSYRDNIGFRVVRDIQ